MLGRSPITTNSAVPMQKAHMVSARTGTGNPPYTFVPGAAAPTLSSTGVTFYCCRAGDRRAQWKGRHSAGYSGARRSRKMETSARVFHDVEAGAAPVGAVAMPFRSTKTSAEWSTTGRLGRGSTSFFGAGGTQRADLDRPELVADVVDPHAGVLVGGEDQLRALKAARPVLVDVVRPEMAADGDVVAVARQREGGDADRVRSSPGCRRPRSA